MVLPHDIRRVGVWREESRVGDGQEARGDGRPWIIGPRNIGHDSGTVDEGAHVVGPLAIIDLGAIDQIVGAVVDVEARVNQPDGGHPVPLFLRPVRVGAVAGVPSQTGSELEEPAVGDGGLVVVAGVGSDPLPFQAASALGVVPAPGKIVKHAFGEDDPRGG